MIVRSIKRIKRGEEVTVAYTDLLQPKVVKSFYTSFAVLFIVVKIPIHETIPNEFFSLDQILHYRIQLSCLKYLHYVHRCHS